MRHSSHFLPILLLFSLTFLQETNAENCFATQEADVVFVFDVSWSVTEADVIKTREFVSYIRHKLINLPKNGYGVGYRVAVVLSSYYPNVTLRLTPVIRPDVKNVIDSRTKWAGIRDTLYKAVWKFEEVFYESCNWRGPFVSRYAVVMTNGRTEKLKYTKEMMLLYSALYAVNVIIVGIGRDSWRNVLQQFAPGSNLFDVRNNDDADQIVKLLVSRNCIDHKSARFDIQPQLDPSLIGTTTAPPEIPFPIPKNDFGKTSFLKSVINTISNDTTILMILCGGAVLVTVLSISAIVLCVLKRKASSGSSDYRNQNANILEASGSRSGMKFDDEERNTYDQKSLDSRRSENHEQNYEGILDKSGQNIALEASTE